ncbi:MAG: DMT family transporter [Burkholderiaceae bacterium]
MVAACGAAFLWGTGALVVNLLIARFGLSPESISFWRFVVGAVLLLALFARPAVWPRLRAQAATLVGAGACMALYVLCWFLGIARIGAAVPTLIALCLPPVLVTLVAVARGRERLDATLVATLAGALAGTVLVVLREGGPAAGASTATVVAGVLFSVASAVLYAGFTLVSGRLSVALGAGPATMGLTIVAAVVMGLSALYAPLAWPGDVPPEAWLLYLGLVTAALALLAFSWGAARLSPTALTVATLVEPLTAVLLAALLLGQVLSASQWVGAVLMLASIVALGRRDGRRASGGSPHGG